MPGAPTPYPITPPDAIIRMLHLNSTPLAKVDDDAYKVLIMDRFCRSILSPLLRVNDLRKHGVTLHLLLDSDRQPIPDVPAIYFVQPTDANIARIVQDAAQRRYDALHCNFSTSLPRPLMEHFATLAARNDCAARVTRVYDQYLGFIALEKDLFSLCLPRAYLALHDPSEGDAQVEASVATIIDGLFSVIATLGVVPIIRCPRGGVAEHVATLLDMRIRDHLKARTGLFPEGAAAAPTPRPLLVLLDRNFDLAGAVKHSWSYQPLAHDLLGLKLNRITVQESPAQAPQGGAPAKPAEKTSYEVGEDDFFWEENGGRPFPKIAEEVELQLQKYRAAVEDVNRRAASVGGTFQNEAELLEANTKNLMSAVSSLPELTERKKVLDKHTNIATALLHEIKRRHTDQFFSVEEDILAGKGDKAPAMEILNGRRGSPEDRLRLALVMTLAASAAGGKGGGAESDLESLLTEAADLPALAYVRQMSAHNLAGGAAPRGAAGPGGSGASQSNLLDWAGSTFGQGLSAVTKGVRSLLSGERQSPVITVVEQLMEGRAGSEAAEAFVVLDPRGPKGGAPGDRAKGSFTDAVVFMIGGGNYEEYQALKEWTVRSASQAGAAPGDAGARSVIYGSTELLSGSEFVAQLSELGRKTGVAPAPVAARPAAP